MRKRYIAAAAAAVVFVAFTVTGYASIAGVPDTEGTIHACVKNPTYGNPGGQTRIVPAAHDYGGSSIIVPTLCASNESSTTWQQSGPVADSTVTSSIVTVSMTSSADAYCDAGSTLLSGGYTYHDGGANFNVTESRPTDNRTGWHVEVAQTEGSVGADFVVYVVCASLRKNAS